MGHSNLSCPQLRCSSLLFVALLLLCFGVVISATNDTDKLALLAFKAEITSDPFGSLNSWNDSTDFCRWDGVMCSRRHHRVMRLDLDSQKLSGSISPHIGNLSFLRILNLNNNSFSLEIPPQIARLRRLRVLYLSDNSLMGSDADELSFLCSLTNASDLSVFGMAGNRFGGMLPVCIGNFSTTMTHLGVGMNMISGEIPIEIGNLVNLQKLLMMENLHSGSIPSVLGNLSNLGLLDLSGNCLSGRVPNSLRNLQRLVKLYLHQNNFEGPIPSYLQNHQSLMRLDLSSNNFSGSVIFPMVGNLIYLNLSQNHLSGVLPMEIGNLKHLVSLDVSGNILDGEIPGSLGNCDGLIVLGMQDNLFHGSIPQSINSLKSIEELDLSINNFSGEIPKFLEAFQYLKKLNLSYNHLEGALPTQGVFRNASVAFVVGNEKLCGGMLEFELPRCISKNSKSRGVHKLKLTIAVLFGLLGITLVVTFLYLYCLKRKKKEPISSCLDDSMLNLSYGTLLKATNGFSSANLIGAGSFGFVYKGLLQDNENSIAVKVLNLTWHGALKSFKAECEALKHMKHRNLLKVLTACSSIDYNGDEFKALVGTIGYAPPEYANGSQVSREGDVYSYGVLLLEIFTGLSPTSNTFRDNLNLHNYVAEAIPQRAIEITDPALLHEGESHNSSQDSLHESNRIFQECLETIYRIGLACSVEEPRRRMSIDKVATQLHSIKKKLFAASLLL
ncbi:hypothetical protein EUGRSUZ_F04082 [Eucalyptus grandis]|uniref:Uncharacterized protein n=2 Tax=Eucalyptus grandis TaxID=71139 RepID=A0ACC3KNY0_EUCGR|nr:hypothetical protein EUGRSUZ_F04082 [Eucalyptus grandis]